MADIIPTEVPYRCEYAKTGRAACKGCKGLIEKDELKIAFMVQSRFHDGKDAWWHHPPCFFKQHHPKSVGDISHFEQLRWEDQELIKKSVGAIVVPTGATNARAKDKTAQKGILKDFVIAYAVSAQSMCQVCQDKIPKGEIRISKKDYESESAMMYSRGAGLDKWHDLDCFVKVREELGFYEPGKLIPGFDSLEKKDKKEVTAKLPAIKAPAIKAPASSSNGSGKRKLNEEKDGTASGSAKRAKTDNPDESKIKKQNKQMFKYRDALNDWSTKDLRHILTTNKQEIPVETSHALLDRITDIMTFGALKPCSSCKGQIVFRSGVGYQCLGDFSEYTKCMAVTDSPERVPFKVPKDFRELDPFVSYKFKEQKRVFEKVAPSSTVTSVALDKDAEETGPKRVRKPLNKFGFLISCEDEDNSERWATKIESFGGRVYKKNVTSAAALITTEDDVANMSKSVEFAKAHGIPVVKGEFVDSLVEMDYNLRVELNKNLICDWTKDVTPWLQAKNKDYETMEKKKEERKSGFEKFEKNLKSVKLIMKDGAVVDPDSKLEAIGHVLRDGKTRFFNCVLNRSNVEEGKNSYYKMQVIESDKGKRYWVFQAWGRIGTIIGGKKTHEGISKGEAIEIFESKFYEQTGNQWGQPFVKRPSGYTQLEIDYGEKEHLKLVPNAIESALPMSVQEVICMIFDVARMKQAMAEFELNLEEMPLGKISRKQILKAYSALSDAFNLFQKAKDGDSEAKKMILDITNRFYTMIPHNFGARLPPILDNEVLVKNKLEMLDSLMEIELAYEMLLEGDKGGEASLDSHYKTLDAAIDPLESGSEEYGMLVKYLNNTHADSHSHYSLGVDYIFKVNRKSEAQSYKPYKNFHNRKLLWHGSRITNFAGILKQGLRIAPLEAPVTGYMFGKGVYFADMVSKSANYCFASRDNNSGLLLVCEVALGDMHELKKSKDTLLTAPKNKNSVKGCGLTEPNPAESIILEDGVEVPLGKGVKSSAKNSELLYNEYIVYDTAQVNIRYLMKVNFNFTGRH